MGLFETLRRSFGKRAGGVRHTDVLAIRGYGVEAIPLKPFSAAHLDDDTVSFGPVTPDGPHRPEMVLIPGRAPLTVTPYLFDEEQDLHALGSSEHGTTALVLPPGARDARESLAEYTTVPLRAETWQVRTNAWEIPFPRGFVLRAHEDGSFELSADEAVTMTVIGPFRGKGEVPSPDRLAPEGTNFVDQGVIRTPRETIAWFEFGHPVGGTPRRQRYYELIGDSLSFTVYLLHVDTPAGAASAAYAIADAMAAGFVPVYHADGQSG